MSDSYLGKTGNSMSELSVKLININLPENHPILEHCRPPAISAEQDLIAFMPSLICHYACKVWYIFKQMTNEEVPYEQHERTD